MAKKSRPDIPKPKPTEAAETTFPGRWAWILVAAGIVFCAAIRIRLLNMPIERDEGEFAYMGQLMLQGIPPYKLAYNMKFPGIYVVYALVLGIFGQSIAAIHIGVLIANSAAAILLFLIAKRLFDPLTGALAAITFGLLSVSPSVLGFAGHATQYVLPFALGGLLMLLKGMESRKAMPFVWTGLLLGTAVLMKQHAAFFIVFAVVYLLLAGWRTLGKRSVGYAAILAGTSLAPFALTCFWLYAAGVFRTFWFWTITYAREYVGELGLHEGLFMLWIETLRVVATAAWLWLIAAIGFTALIWSPKARRHWLFIAGFSLSSFLAICPGMFFRTQYYILTLPATGILIGLAITCAIERLAKSKDYGWLRAVPIMLFALAVLSSVNKQAAFFFRLAPEQASRVAYGINPFPEAIEIARYIGEHSTSRDTVAVLGSEPEIYFLSGRKSATGHIYVYGLMESQPFASRMQREMMGEIERAKPRFLVFTNVPTSWTKRPTSDLTIFGWLNAYAGRYYHPVGLLEIITDDYTASYWGPDAEFAEPQSAQSPYIRVYERSGG